MKSTLLFLTAVLICGDVSAGADPPLPKPNVVFNPGGCLQQSPMLGYVNARY